MKILFLGEGDLSGPARYLSAVLQWAKIPFDHRPDGSRLPKPWRRKRYDAVVLSDYRYASWTPCAKEWLIREVSERGMGLLMIGGWASFTGLVGGYAGTDIESLLPVRCIKEDDRVQQATGALLVETAKHSLLNRLSWQSPPIVCGYHRCVPKSGTQTVLSFRDLKSTAGRITLGPERPALVLGTAGRARTAAFLTDCAPHWAGGLVDWGKRRVTVRLTSMENVEAGDQYLRLFQSIIRWVSGQSS